MERNLNYAPQNGDRMQSGTRRQRLRAYIHITSSSASASSSSPWPWKDVDRNERVRSSPKIILPPALNIPGGGESVFPPHAGRNKKRAVRRYV